MKATRGKNGRWSLKGLLLILLLIRDNPLSPRPCMMNFIIRADYKTWKVMILGELNPMNALMSGKV